MLAVITTAACTTEENTRLNQLVFSVTCHLLVLNHPENRGRQGPALFSWRTKSWRMTMQRDQLNALLPWEPNQYTPAHLYLGGLELVRDHTGHSSSPRTSDQRWRYWGCLHSARWFCTSASSLALGPSWLFLFQLHFHLWEGVRLCTVGAALEHVTESINTSSSNSKGWSSLQHTPSPQSSRHI